MRKFRLAVVLLLLSLVLTALISCGDDPDPCDPDCPPTNCGETETECALPETPPASQVPVQDPGSTTTTVPSVPNVLTYFNYAIAELEGDGGWTFGRMDRNVMHAGCWPEYYSEFDPEDLPPEINEMLADPWCIIGPYIPKPGPSIQDAMEVPE